MDQSVGTSCCCFAEDTVILLTFVASIVDTASAERTSYTIVVASMGSSIASVDHLLASSIAAGSIAVEEPVVAVGS